MTPTCLLSRQDPKLNVAGNVRGGTSGNSIFGPSDIDFGGTFQINTPDYLRIWETTNAVAGALRFGVGNVQIYGHSTYGLWFRPDGTTRMALSPSGGLSLGSTFYSTNPGSGNAIIEGNVGIGTTAPSHQLDVVPSDAIAARFDGRVIVVDAVNANEFVTKSQLDATSGTLPTTSEGYTLRGNGSAWQATSSLFVKSDGHVGIGYTSPTSLLHIGAGTATVAPLKLTSGTNLTTPQAGAFEYDGGALIFTPATDRRSVSLANGVIIADTTVANTVAETTVYTESVSANELYKGSKWHTRISGYYSTANSSASFTAKLKIGNTVVETLTSVAENVNNGFWRLEFFFTVRDTGPTGAIRASVDGIFNTTLETNANTSDVIIDTTAVEDITLTIQWNAANAGNTLTVTQGHTEIFGVTQN